MATTTALPKMTAEFVNLTEHVLNVLDQDGLVITVKPSGAVARVLTAKTELFTVNNVLVSRTRKEQVVDLPEPKDGVLYLASMAVRDAVPGRFDVLSPGILIRGADGQPTGCQGLASN